MPEFKNLRKKVRRRRTETLLLAIYAFAVTFALFLSLLNRTSQPKLPIRYTDEDGFSVNNDVLTPAFNDSAVDNPFELAYAQINSIRLLSDNDMIIQKFELSQNGQSEIVMPIESKPKSSAQKNEFSGIYQKEHHVLVVKSGDTFIGMLTELGMDTKTATDAYNTLRKVFDARNLKVNQYLELSGTFDIQTHQLEALDTLTFEPFRGTKYILKVNEYDKFEAKVEQEQFARDVKVVKGVIDAQVSSSLSKAGLPRSMIDEIIRRFSHLINFRTDIHKGDTFNIKYEVSKTAEGSIVKTGNLLYASFTTSKRNYNLYRYKDEFYTEKGETKKTGLDIKPMQVRNARISSLFGYRMHPIYKTRKFHSGVDYAAPRGTQIYASGNGIVEMARYVNGYGNFVKIRHNSEYETAYGHMQGFAKGIKPGVKVRKGQVIGYVGSTGRSTGPHLHFEIIRKGERINPLKAKVATGSDLTGRQLTDFKQEIKRIDSLVEKIAKVKTKISKPLGTTASQLAKQDSHKKLLLLPLSSVPANEKMSESIQDNNITEDSQTKDITPVTTVEAENNQPADIQIPSEEKDEISAPEQTAVAEDETEIEDTVEQYKGKIIYPIKENVAQLRENNLIKNSPQLKKMAKIVKIPTRKPKQSQRTSR